jgi:hypothetical protein
VSSYVLVFGSFFKEKFPDFVNSSEVRRIIPACLVLTAFWNNTLKQSHLRNGQVISLGPSSLPFHYRLYFTVDKLSSKKPGFCRSLIGSSKDYGHILLLPHTQFGQKEMFAFH